jgi:hypothetical protein
MERWHALHLSPPPILTFLSVPSQWKARAAALALQDDFANIEVLSVSIDPCSCGSLVTQSRGKMIPFSYRIVRIVGFDSNGHHPRRCERSCS